MFAVKFHGGDFLKLGLEAAFSYYVLDKTKQIVFELGKNSINATKKERS